MNTKELDSIIKFISTANKIKSTRRTGWARSRLPIPEHVGDHSFSTALISYIFARRMGLDAEKCMALGLIHDIHESITGDIALRPEESMQAVSNKRKKILEHRDTLRLLSFLPNGDRRNLKTLWSEFEKCETKEAKLVHEVDALDYIMELFVHDTYDAKQKKKTQEFFLTAGRRIRSKELAYIYGKIKAEVLG